MSEERKLPDKAVDSTGETAKPKKPLEYRRFEAVLKKVIKAPPMKKTSR
jgi:hypothetical protein